MLGLSLGKILLTIAVIVAIWRAWKFIAPMVARMQQPEPTAPRNAASAKPDRRALELIECPRCGTFIPSGTVCPHHGPGRPS